MDFLVDRPSVKDSKPVTHGRTQTYIRSGKFKLCPGLRHTLEFSLEIRDLLNVKIIVRDDEIIGLRMCATLKLVYMHRMTMEWLTSDYFIRTQLHLGPQPIKAKASHLSVTFFKGTTKIPVGRTLTTPIVTSSLSRF